MNTEEARKLEKAVLKEYETVTNLAYENCMKKLAKIYKGERGKK